MNSEVEGDKRKTFTSAPAFDPSYPEGASTFVNGEDLVAKPTSEDADSEVPVTPSLGSRLDRKGRRILSGVKSVGRSVGGVAYRTKNALANNPTSSTNIRDRESNTKLIVVAGAGLGLSCMLCAGIVALTIRFGPSLAVSGVKELQKSAVVESPGESITKQEEVVKLVQTNIDGVKLTQADGVTPQEFKRNIAIRNEVINFAKFARSAGVKGDMNEINFSPVFAKETVFVFSKLHSETFKTLMDGKYYKDGLTRSSFSLSDLDTMNPKNREDAISILSTLLNHSIRLAYMADISSLPKDSALYSFANPFRVGYLEFTNGSETPSEPVTAFTLVNDKNGKTHVSYSRLYKASEIERSPNYDEIFKDSLLLLQFFAGGRIYP